MTNKQGKTATEGGFKKHRARMPFASDPSGSKHPRHFISEIRLEASAGKCNRWNALRRDAPSRPASPSCLPPPYLLPHPAALPRPPLPSLFLPPCLTPLPCPIPPPLPSPTLLPSPVSPLSKNDFLLTLATSFPQCYTIRV